MPRIIQLPIATALSPTDWVAVYENATGRTKRAPLQDITGGHSHNAADIVGLQVAIDASVASVVGAAPGTLDTLNELATALGGDANFAATTAANIASRLRFDAGQALNSAQRRQGQLNLGAPLIETDAEGMTGITPTAIGQLLFHTPETKLYRAWDTAPGAWLSSFVLQDLTIQGDFEAGGLTSIGKLVWVDSVHGSDVTGLRASRSKPFATLEAARTAANSGDTIIVGPGAYTVAASLAKDGVNWYFHMGSSVTRSGANITGIWDDLGTAMSYRVDGYGDFNFILTGNGFASRSAIRVNHASSVVSIRARDVSCNQTSGDTPDLSAVYVSAGEFNGWFRNLSVIGNTTSKYGVWWSNGKMYVEAHDISTTTGPAVYGGVNATPTGDGYVRAFNLSGQQTVACAGSDTTAALWVHADTIRGGGTSKSAVSVNGANRCYVTAQKLFGSISCISNATLVYVTADKVSAVANGTSVTANLLHVSGANANVFLRVMHWDPAGFTGETFKITNGTTRVLGGDLVSGTAKGVEITGGTLRLNGLRIDTSANNASNPLTKSGGTLVIQNTVLIAEATRDSISAPTAQSVIAYASYTNRDLDPDVTVIGELMVNASFV